MATDPHEPFDSVTRVDLTTTSASVDELRRRSAEGDTQAVAELVRRGGVGARSA